MRSKRDLINRRKTGFPIQVAAVVIWGAVNRVWAPAMEEITGDSQARSSLYFVKFDAVNVL
jgi:hypothetical protein